MGHYHSDINDIVVWARIILAVACAARYTMLHNWWNNPAGRAFMALDACLVTVMIPQAASAADPSLNVQSPLWSWVSTVAMFGIAAVLVYRMISLERQRRLRLHRASHGQATRPSSPHDPGALGGG